jgi:ubiquinone/menaquinone biosynthesis C-methylase UbiE
MVWGLDYSPEMVEMASKVNAEFINEGRVKVFQASVSQIPSGDSFFDLAVACETIHFWPDLRRDLREVFRVLKRGGHFVVVNKYAKNDKEAASLEKYFSLHSPEEFRSALEVAGFSVQKVQLEEKKGQIILVGKKFIN